MLYMRILLVVSQKLKHNKGLQWTAMLPSVRSNIQIPGKSFVNAKTLHAATETRRYAI